MNRETLRSTIHLMLSEEFTEIWSRTERQHTAKLRQIIKGTDQDERNRGWVEALEWLLRMPKDIQKEIADDVKNKGEDVAPPEEG